MNRAEYLAALHGALDARRDPLDDAIVRDWLAAHPEDLSEFAAMRAALAPTPRPATRPAKQAPRHRIWPLLLPTLAAAAALLLLLRADRPTPAPALPERSDGVLAVTSSVSIAPAKILFAAPAGAAVLADSIHYERTSAF